MKVVVRISPKDDTMAWALLMRHSPGIALPNRTFILSEEAVRPLGKAGIRFKVISREGEVPETNGVPNGERI